MLIVDNYLIICLKFLVVNYFFELKIKNGEFVNILKIYPWFYPPGIYNKILSLSFLSPVSTVLLLLILYLY